MAPVQANIIAYIWDDVHFVEGTSIDYPHPDRDYYDISTSSDGVVTGAKLHHFQINHDTSNWLAGLGITVVCGGIGGVVGTIIGGPTGTSVGGFVGIVLGLMAGGVGLVLQDEEYCIWFWLSISIVDWLISNAWWLPSLGEAGALVAIYSAFLLYGYFRLGSTTLCDAVGAGNPAPPPPPHSPPGGSGGGCPMQFAWNGTAFIDYGIVNIHNPTGEDITKEVSISVQDVSISNYKALFKLREGWEGLNYSESILDQIKLYAISKSGMRYPCPLTSATHSVFVNVITQLLANDDYKVQILLSQTIELTFVIPYQNAKGFLFVIEGCNTYKEPY